MASRRRTIYLERGRSVLGSKGELVANVSAGVGITCSLCGFKSTARRQMVQEFFWSGWECRYPGPCNDRVAKREQAMDGGLKSLKALEGIADIARGNAPKKQPKPRKKDVRFNTETSNRTWGPSVLTYDSLLAAVEVLKKNNPPMPIYDMKGLMESLGVDLDLEAAVNREPSKKKPRTKPAAAELQAPADAPEGYVPRNIVLIRREP